METELKTNPEGSKQVSFTETLKRSLTQRPNRPKSKKSAKMLSTACLSDLFRRLDRDGNGELDLGEFLQVSKKLKWDADEELLTRFGSWMLFCICHVTNAPIITEYSTRLTSPSQARWIFKSLSLRTRRCDGILRCEFINIFLT